MPRFQSLSLLSVFFLTGALSAYQTQEECCEPSPHPERATLRHIESKGIGYNQGYTTLEGFFTVPNLMDTAWFPFLDIRGHLFNDGKSAANTGVGLRYIRSSSVWGVNSYFDYRNTHRHHYNQYGLGFEWLSKVIDFRINGYFPFGKQKSSFSSAKFSGFKGHSLILSRKREFTFKGFNAEVGAHSQPTKHLSVYTAVGPYYIDHGSRNAWGGEIRVALDITDYLRIEGNASYDRIFKGIGQGQISLNLPFGHRKRMQGRKENNSLNQESVCSIKFNDCDQNNINSKSENLSDTCSEKLMLRHRALQRVDRHEIIAVEKRRFQTKAINPATGQPYFFVFVNNTSHSDGTFESPYPTLTLAQANSAPNDIIMVFPGSGAPYLDQPITLKESQKLWGTGLSYPLQTTLGQFVIPALSSSFPMISTTVTTPAVTLGNNNEVAGMQFSQFNGPAIQGGSSALLTPGITNTNIHQNIFLTGLNQGINLDNCSGNLLITNNRMTNVVTGISLINLNVIVNANWMISNNVISNSSNVGIGIEVDSPSGHINALIANNRVDLAGVANIGIVSNVASGQIVCATIQNNVCTNSPGQGLVTATNLNTGQHIFHLLGNTFTGNGVGGFVAQNMLGANCYSFSNNTSLLNGTAGYIFLNSAGTLNVEDFSNFSLHNTGTIAVPVLPVTSVPVGTCACQ